MYHRLQRVKLAKASGVDGISTWLQREFAFELSVPVSNIFNASLQEETVPSMWKKGYAGTKLGPIVFLALIKDASPAIEGSAEAWKYVDDMTLSEARHNAQPTTLQEDSLVEWTDVNYLELNLPKGKAMMIPFMQNPPPSPALTIKTSALESRKLMSLVEGVQRRATNYKYILGNQANNLTCKERLTTLAPFDPDSPLTRVGGFGTPRTGLQALYKWSKATNICRQPIIDLAVPAGVVPGGYVSHQQFEKQVKSISGVILNH
ncbi:hypothetical protein Bbelb_144070 [Branchiostoma belcheri]|nr:hypothetical protein Bbelb_144070 [Branchiostoma belcheri]